MSTLFLFSFEKLREVAPGMNIGTMLKLYRHHWDSLHPKGAIMGPNLDNGVVVNNAIFESLLGKVR